MKPASAFQRPRRLLIISAVQHYEHHGRLFAFGPYVREIDQWADLFTEVVIAGPWRQESPPPNYSPFARTNIQVVPIAEAYGDGFWAKCHQAALLPQILWQLARCIAKADAIHVRCPGRLGLLGCVLAPLGSDSLIAKYAMQWKPYQGEPWSWRLQRAILASWWWHGPVTVYGQWAGLEAKVIPLFTSTLSEDQLEHARQVSLQPRDPCIFRVLIVGRLAKSKNIEVVCEAFERLKLAGRRLECVVVGEGPERDELEWKVAEMGLVDSVRFTGELPLEEVLQCCERSNVFVLASEEEGWPNALVEAMSFGLACIGTECGLIPQMLAEGRGLLVKPRDVDSLATALQFVAEHPKEATLMGVRASDWARRYSLQGLKKALRQLMEEWWS